MRVDKTEKIAGLPIIKVRDLLRDFGSASISFARIASFLRLPDDQVLQVIDKLIALHLIKREKDWDGEAWFSLGDKGSRLAITRFVPRINRKKAEKIVEQFLGRVHNLNQRDELNYRVSIVKVFGSYLDATDDLGDVDLAVGLRRRRPHLSVVEENKNRAQQSGRTFSTYSAILDYAKYEIRLILKARSPYVSLHELDEIEELGVKSKTLFELKEE